MIKEERSKTVYGVTMSILSQLDSLLSTSSGKAILADLRNSVGRPVSDSIGVWGLMFEYLPESFLSNKGTMTKEELAIISALQLYALYQQGDNESVLPKRDADATQNRDFRNIGHHLGALRQEEGGRLPADRRFNALITSGDFDELIYHLRQMMMLLKSRSKGIEKIDFARLADDFYWFLRNREEQVRIRWATQYYSRRAEGGEANEL